MYRNDLQHNCSKPELFIYFTCLDRWLWCENANSHQSSQNPYSGEQWKPCGNSLQSHFLPHCMLSKSLHASWSCCHAVCAENLLFTLMSNKVGTERICVFFRLLSLFQDSFTVMPRNQLTNAAEFVKHPLVRTSAFISKCNLIQICWINIHGGGGRGGVFQHKSQKWNPYGLCPSVITMKKKTALEHIWKWPIEIFSHFGPLRATLSVFGVELLSQLA